MENKSSLKEKLTEAKTWVEKSNINQPWVEKGG